MQINIDLLLEHNIVEKSGTDGSSQYYDVNDGFRMEYKSYEVQVIEVNVDKGFVKFHNEFDGLVDTLYQYDYPEDFVVYELVKKNFLTP